MSSGWLTYHKYPPKRKCPVCGKRVSLVRKGGFSNGEDVWGFPPCKESGKAPHGLLASNWVEGGMI
jgi:hypothetical protein